MTIFVLPLILLTAVPPEAAYADGCSFQLGFATLDQLLPTTIGSCVDDEAHNPANGDAIQHTTGGLLVWRKADNWTAFTDGSQTWINGPNGVVKRVNTERFTWEANPDGLPIADGGDQFPPLPPRFVSHWYTHNSGFTIKADGSAGIVEVLSGEIETAQFTTVHGDFAYGRILTDKNSPRPDPPLTPATIHVLPHGKIELRTGNEQPTKVDYWCGGPFWENASSALFQQYWNCGA